MPDQNERIYDSAPPEPDDDFWLEQGREMLQQSISAVRHAAKALMAGLGLLKGIFLAILGFSDLLPKAVPLSHKCFFALPFMFWLVSLYCCLEVMMTRRLYVNLNSPDDVRKKSALSLDTKQDTLQWAFWMLATGLAIALLLLLFRLRF